MDLRETLSALLPPRRDDEPPTLRQDILDELGDHLGCAYNRELLRGADSQLARQRVLERFGDPAAVARRLWFDAMKGIIMAQRVVIVTCSLVTMASLSLVGLVWMQSSRAAAQAMEERRKFSDALAQSQIASKDMLKTLSEMSDAIRNPRSPDWNPVTIKLTEETTNGAPVVGCSISLSQRGGANATINRTTDDSGVADFGLLHPGTYSYSLCEGQNFRSPIGS
ncbi:MAG TPA: carboxypeptidase-like regulatory domain-containing protein, partial [Isosphaeraceae bacterium]|nr:carboxypeptidase-like regulatory domain-containing protein [Isosphaeraceae bacterium]